MDILQTLVSKLQAYKPDWDIIARSSGVPLGTLVRVGMKYTENPRIQTVEALWRGVQRYEQERRA